MAGERHRRGQAAVRGANDRLSALGRDLDRRRARARRLWRTWQTTEQVGADILREPEAWSKAIDDALQTAEAISRVQARELDGIVIKFEALWWWLVEDDSVLDANVRLWLSRFRRDLRRLGASK